MDEKIVGTRDGHKMLSAYLNLQHEICSNVSKQYFKGFLTLIVSRIFCRTPQHLKPKVKDVNSSYR